MKGQKVLDELLEGNGRFVEGSLEHPRQGPGRRSELLNGQKPKAIVLSCSDSRVPPEIIFDQGLGDLFVVRVAGNVYDALALGSIEYAAENLETPLLIVLGHIDCGAVKATIEGSEPIGSTGSFIGMIKEAVEKASGEKEEMIANAVRANVERIVESLNASGSIVGDRVLGKKLLIAGAVYDLSSGIVEVVCRT